jgi:hypothetical protein
MAMKGRHWDAEKNMPDPTLKGFLTKKANSIKNRVSEATGVTVDPICYSAGYTEDDGEQLNPYNLSKLLYYADNLNEEEQNWLFNDDDMDYAGEVKQSFFESLFEGIGEGLEKGAITGGCIIGVPGMIVGGLIGGILGGLHSLIIKPLTS